MPRPTTLLSALAAVVALAGLAVPAPAAAAQADAPLSLTIDRLSPSSIPKSGKVMVSGWVTNNSDETWVDVAVYTFIAADPITTSDDLAFESTKDAEVQVGERITTPGTFDTIAELAPGASMPYTDRVPVEELKVDEPGAYWFGVHALGTNADGRDDVADGRARTFLPYVPPRNRDEPVATSLVLPVRHQVLHDPDGKISGVDGWLDTLDDSGQLSSVLEFGQAAGGRPITWLLDPAVPAAARQIAAGNPARELVPPADDGTGVGEEPSAGPSDGQSESSAPEPSPAEARAAETATRWLARLNQAVAGKQLLALPWGDVDVAAAAKRDKAVYTEARARSGEVLSVNQSPMTPAMSAPSGFLDDAALALADSGTTVLLSDRAVARGQAPTVATYDGRKVIFSSSAVLAGGPGPDDPLAPVALRQRILSEAAVRLSEPSRQPLVVVFPPRWRPPGGPDYSEFFEGLDVDWMRLETLQDASAQAGHPVSADRFTYPNWQRNHEVDDAAFAALADLDDDARRLQAVLTTKNDLASRIRTDSLGNVSYFARRSPVRSRLATIGTMTWVRGQLRQITVSGPPRVILSSESGPFSVTITNGLDEPVTVRIKATSDPPMTIEGPDRLELQPDSTTTRLLQASTDKLGVHDVTISLTDLDGEPLGPGSSTLIPIRAAQVSGIIWLIMGGALALLVFAIALRLVRRIRGTGRGGGGNDEGDGDGPSSDDPAGLAAPEPAAEPAPAR